MHAAQRTALQSYREQRQSFKVQGAGLQTPDSRPHTSELLNMDKTTLKPIAKYKATEQPTRKCNSYPTILPYPSDFQSPATIHPASSHRYYATTPLRHYATTEQTSRQDDKK
uniref:Uncharacterized protein n=1 Tax=Palpitomonas bilix TaxID=652834 RepID=A0A7S3D7N7_9EUKA